MANTSKPARWWGANTATLLRHGIVCKTDGAWLDIGGGSRPVFLTKAQTIALMTVRDGHIDKKDVRIGDQTARWDHQYEISGGAARALVEKGLITRDYHESGSVYAHLTFRLLASRVMYAPRIG